MESASALQIGQNCGQPVRLATSPLEIRRILVATDYSEPACRAIEAAVAIAGVYSSEVVLAHASTPFHFAAGEGVIPDLLVDQLAEDEAQMKDLVSRIPELAALRVETIIDYASPVSMILDLVQKMRPDLIVLGSEGPSGMERVALGSVAETIAHAVTVPVLIMGPHAHTNRKPFKSIVFATDMHTTGLRPAQYASSLAEAFHSHLLLLHVIEREPEYSSLRSEIEDRMREDMRSLLPADAGRNFPYEFAIDYGKPAERIVEAARSVEATLVVLGSRRGGLMEDHLPWMTLSQVIREASCGVMVVRNCLS